MEQIGNHKFHLHTTLLRLISFKRLIFAGTLMEFEPMERDKYKVRGNLHGFALQLSP
jgi:hypothetical protein